MNSKLFLTKLNIWTKLVLSAKQKSYSTNRLIHKIRQNFEHKTQSNFLWCLSTNKKFSFGDRTEGSLKLSKRGLSGDRGSGEDPDGDERHSRNRPLMEIKPIFFPNLWYKWTNFLNVNTIIRPFFDNQFNINDFMSGAKQALVHISHCLADGNIDSLKGLITEQALVEIRRNFSLLNSREKSELRVDFEDIMFSFPYRIGIIMNEDERRWVEITVVYYCMYKYKSLIEEKQISFEEFRKRFGQEITVCNYRFIREYTKGVDSEWSVNLLGHFRNVSPV